MATLATGAKIAPCLWFDKNAEEAARLYVSLLPDSRITRVVRAPADNPSTRAGEVILVDFTLAGRDFVGLNGGPQSRFTEAVSFCIYCDDQAEVDRLWAALIADGGAPSQCGWLKDKFGLSWQITPRVLLEMINDADPQRARRAFEAMMQMTKIDIAALQKAVANSAAA